MACKRARSRRWGDVYLTVVSIPRQEISLHECLADVYMVAEHVVLSRQGKNSAEPAGVRHRAESVFKVAKACVVLSAHVLALNDQTDFAFLELAVFTFDLVVKPGGENFVHRDRLMKSPIYRFSELITPLKKRPCNHAFIELRVPCQRGSHVSVYACLCVRAVCVRACVIRALLQKQR